LLKIDKSPAIRTDTRKQLPEIHQKI